jgi:hypothetical protein
MGFITEHSAVNCMAEHHKSLFWRRFATKLSPLVAPQLYPDIGLNRFRHNQLARVTTLRSLIGIRGNADRLPSARPQG